MDHESSYVSDSPDIGREILRLAEARGEASFCPSEVARRCASGQGEAAWRSLMPVVREVAIDLAEAGSIEVTQAGRLVDARQTKGPIRLRLPRKR